MLLTNRYRGSRATNPSWKARGEKYFRRQREKRNVRSVGLKIGTLRVGVMTHRGRELMQKRMLNDVLCMLETKGDGSKAKGTRAVSNCTTVVQIRREMEQV